MILNVGPFHAGDIESYASLVLPGSTPSRRLGARTIPRPLFTSFIVTFRRAFVTLRP